MGVSARMPPTALSGAFGAADQRALPVFALTATALVTGVSRSKEFRLAYPA